MSANHRGHVMMLWIIAVGVINTLAVMLRFCLRKRSGIRIGKDDWLILASLIPANAMILVTWFCVLAGAGEHQATLSMSRLSSLLKVTIPAMITYGLTITLVKISILLLYRRIFKTPNLQRVTSILGILCTCWFVASVFGLLFLCTPLSAFWDPELLFSSKCGDFEAYLLGVTISNMILDIAILCTPLPLVWNLQLPVRKKLEICSLFLLGSFTCIVSLMRIISLSYVRNSDFTYTSLIAYLGNNIEPATAIWCACLMTYRPLFAYLGSRLQSAFHNTRLIPSRDKWWQKRKVCNISSNSRSHSDKSENRESSSNKGNTPCFTPASDVWSSPDNQLDLEAATFQDLNSQAMERNSHILDPLTEPPSPERSYRYSTATATALRGESSSV